MKLFVASLPPEADPDTLLAEQGAEALQECIRKGQAWYKWIANQVFKPETGKPDPHEAVKEYLQLIKDIDSETELEEALDLAAELSGQKLTAIKKQLTKERKGDGRALTSAANGAAGGRARNPYADMTDEFIGRYKKDDVFTIRRYKGAWMRYRKNQWRPVSEEDIESVIMTWIRRKYRDLSEMRTLKNMILNLRAAELCYILDDTEVPCWLDKKFQSAKEWMCTKNSIIHLDQVLACFEDDECFPMDESIVAPTPRLFTYHSLPVNFDPDATCPMFLKYLEGVQPDPEDREKIRQMMGLLLVPDTRYNVFFILQGEGGTGKSVLIYIIKKLLGAENVCTVPLTKFEDEHYTYQLTENLVNLIDDMKESLLKDVEGTIKIATDGGELEVRRMRENGRSAPVVARTVAACNVLPRFYEKSDAIWHRLRIFNFDVQFRNTPNQNKNLRYDIVRDELPGIFLWALKGLADLREQNVFPETKKGQALKEKHKAACDPIGTFLREHFRLNPECKIEASEIYRLYIQWSNDGGYRAANQGTVNREVERIFKIEKKSTRVAGHVVQGFKGLEKIEAAFAPRPTHEETQTEFSL